MLKSLIILSVNDYLIKNVYDLKEKKFFIHLLSRVAIHWGHVFLIRLKEAWNNIAVYNKTVLYYTQDGPNVESAHRIFFF